MTHVLTIFVPGPVPSDKGSEGTIFSCIDDQVLQFLNRSVTPDGCQRYSSTFPGFMQFSLIPEEFYQNFN